MNITLEKLTIDDVDNIARYANNKKICKNVTDSFPCPYTIEDAKNFFEMISHQKPLTTFKISFEGKFAGIINSSPKKDIYFKNAEIGYWIAEPFWNKGVATNAVKLIVHYTFNTFPVIERISARVYHYNIGSMKVLEKNGFIKEAIIEKAAYKDNQYVDIHYFRLFR